MSAIQIPKDLKSVRDAALLAIHPICPADQHINLNDKFPFNAQRTSAGRDLPPYYLVYFLLVELLGFNNFGKSEKIAWSVPIDFDSEIFLIEHRKLGIGVFARDAVTDEFKAQRIVNLVKKGVSVAQPFFRWLADEAVQKSELNVVNNSKVLFERFQYFLEIYHEVIHNEQIDGTVDSEDADLVGGGALFVKAKERKNSRWLALAVIDAFFSWTEHIFIHLAILFGKINTGIEVANLAEADWQTKFKAALNVNEPAIKPLFDDLLSIRRQLRNFIAHGAFGKEGQAFSFHSGAGAAPVLLLHHTDRHRFTLTEELSFDESAAIDIIEKFINVIWSGDREPARLYIQDSCLPMILTMAKSGSYHNAMKSVQDMQELVECLNWEFDIAANMDW